MAEQRDVQALAETVRAVLNKAAFGTETGPELLAAVAALDGLVLEHTRQEEALMSECLDVLVERWHCSDTLAEWMELTDAEYARFVEEGPSGYAAAIAARAALSLPGGVGIPTGEAAE